MITIKSVARNWQNLPPVFQKLCGINRRRNSNFYKIWHTCILRSNMDKLGGERVDKIKNKLLLRNNFQKTMISF